MPKNIIFCADGTWNGPNDIKSIDDGSVASTNVYKMFRNFDGIKNDGSGDQDPEQMLQCVNAAGQVTQIAKYLHGVGNAGGFLDKLFGGTIGAGVINRIVRGYIFISQHYEPGDKIFIIGFSRGAYTARALAGMIAGRGLLDNAKLDLSGNNYAYRLGWSVWFDYRQAVNAKAGIWGAIRLFFDVTLSLFGKKINGLLIDSVPIEAVGVWDTVGALGIPVFASAANTLDLFRFTNQKLSEKVQHGFHAVATDERRANFSPTLWDDDPRVEQVLFTGGHGDVGGGSSINNDDSGLSDVAYQWMADKLKGLGVLFSVNPAIVTKPNPLAPAHQAWRVDPWKNFPEGPRSFPKFLKVHRALVDRIAAGPMVCDPSQPKEDYRPSNDAVFKKNGSLAQGVVIDS